MSFEDPGWEGYSPYGDAPAPSGSTPQAAETPAAAAGASGSGTPAAGWDQATGYDDNQPPPPGGGLGRNRILAIAGGVAAVLVVVVLALVLSGGKKPTHTLAATVTTPTPIAATTPAAAPSTPAPATTSAATTPAAPTTPPAPTTAATSTAPTTSSVNTSAKLLTIVPDGFAGHCQEEPQADWLTTNTTDEMVCLTQTVPSASAVLVGIARQKAENDAALGFAGVLKLNDFKAGTGDCSSGNLSGATSKGSYCESPYTAADGSTGSELLFDGSVINVGGASGESSTFCQAAFPGSSGVSVVVYTDPAEHNLGVALNCNTSSSLLEGLHDALTSGTYDLTDD